MASGELSREQVRQQFLDACASSGDGPPPDPDVFVAAFGEPERSSLRSELQALQRGHAYPTKTDSIGETVDHDTDVTVDHSPPPLGTIDHVPPPEGTVDHTPAPVEDQVEQVRRKPRIKDIPVPASVAGYEVIAVLGRGAMGVVYKARQRGLKRLVALKMILSGAHASEMDLARFRAEANAVGELKHPGIVQIYEVGEDEGRPFFSLEFVDGPSLHKKIQGTPLPPRDAATLLQKMAEAMAYAHARGIIHRDLKPANVLLTEDGEPKIGDFGLAKQLEDREDSGLTRSGTVLGTPSYMSPEQAEGRVGEVGPLADVYSLGAILYDMLTGRPPFRGTSVLDTLEQLRTQEPVPPMQFQLGVPRDLETICLKCLQKDRTRRYASAADLAADVGRFLRGEPIKARPVGLVERTWRWCRRNKGKAGAIAACILFLVMYLVTATMLYEREREAHAEAEKQTEIAKEKARLALVRFENQRDLSFVALEGIGKVGENIQNMLRNRRLALDDREEIRKVRAQAMAELRATVKKVIQRLQQASIHTFADIASAQVFGDMMLGAGDVHEAQRLYQEGHELAWKRVEKEPENDRARGNLGIMEMRLGDIALELNGDARKAHEHYLKARALHEEIRTHPREVDYTPLAIKIAVSHDDTRLGQVLLVLGQAAQAHKRLHDALVYREEWLADKPDNAEARSYIMESHMYLAIVAWHRGDAPATCEHFGKSLKIGRELVAESQGYIPFEIDLVEVEGNYGDALLRLGTVAEAEQHYQQSRRLLQSVLQRRPDDIKYQPLLALTHERLGVARKLLGKPTEAKVHFLEAQQLRGELWEVDKGAVSRQIGYVQAMARAGDRPNAVRLANVIRERMVQSPELMLQVARTFAICSTDRALNPPKNVDAALAALSGATGEGFRDAAMLETDPELVRLRDEPRFREMLERIKKR
jgi:serine/threonine-protein kinase